MNLADVEFADLPTFTAEEHEFIFGKVKREWEHRYYCSLNQSPPISIKEYLFGYN